MAILKSVPGIEVRICVGSEPLMKHIDRSTKAERSTVLKYVEVVPGEEFTIRTTTDKSYKWTSPYIVMDIMVDSVVITTHPFGRYEFGQECQASYSHVHECIGSYRIENEQEVFHSLKLSKLSVSHNKELRGKIEDDVSRLEKTGKVKVGLYRAKSVKMLSATQARKHCAIFLKQPELIDRLIKDVHWDAISGRLECQSHIATLGTAKPIVDPRIRTIYDVKYLYFDRSRFVKPQGVYKLRYRSEESLKALLAICWDNAVIKREPTIKLKNDEEDVAEDVTGSIVKQERDEDLVDFFMLAMKRAWLRRNER